MHPGVIRHPEALRIYLCHVPPRPHALIGVDSVEEALQLAVAAGRRVDPGLLDRLGDRTGADIGALCFHVRDPCRGQLGATHDRMSTTQFRAICGISDRRWGYRESPSA